ncbi:hypothetical protein WICPIJ_002032 [Wickerhamomyces pijperi]|uniref:Uncharacterized protein n=1 Tax=Wickerhamomyces pijperi TaxID=599730 RepID=A0A9P8QAI9_WICPI|nr:hypothetical protein WICPIJ_002032 [Wickerhamomyces pijperi]
MLDQKVLRALSIYLLLNTPFLQIHVLAAEDSSLSLEEQHSNLARLYAQGFKSEETYHNHEGEDDDTLSLQSTQFEFDQDEEDENSHSLFVFDQDSEETEDALDPQEDVHTEDSDSDAISEEIEDSEDSDDVLFEDVYQESRSHPHRRINKDMNNELRDQNPGTTDDHEKKTTQDEDIHDELVYEDSTDDESEDTEDGEIDDYEDEEEDEDYEESVSYIHTVDTDVFFQGTFDYEAADFEVDSDEYEENDLYVDFQDSDDDSEEAITFDELLDKTPFNTDDLRKKFRVLFRISVKDYEDEDEDGKVTISGQPEYFNDTYSDIPHSRNKLIIKFPYGPITE